MNKAFPKETENDEAPDEAEDSLPQGQKNYMTPEGLAALKTEYQQLLYRERPKVVEVVSWAAGNGDRSENGDYIYGKKRLREIDRRVRYLLKRIESAVVADPEKQKGLTQVFFGATVRYAREDGEEKEVTLVGIDETDLNRGRISWLSPVARALMKGKAGNRIEVRTPAGWESIEILSIRYGAAEKKTNKKPKTK